jgi:AcrR family transcriptional regulator
VADATTPKRLTRAQSKARTRQQILDAAARVFARKGFAGASVEEIADAAGFTVGALYSNFESKDQLLVELLVAQRARRIEAITAVFADPDLDLATQLVNLARVMGEMADRDPAQGLGAVGPRSLRTPAMKRAVSTQLRGQVAELDGLLAGALERAGIAPGVAPATVTTVVLALVQGLVQRRRHDRAGVDDEVIDQALRWLFTGIEASSPGGHDTPESR